jgi:hypothetical protein
MASTHGAAHLLVRLALFAAVLSVIGCKACREDDDAEEEEERTQQQDHFWRVQVKVVGEGSVAAADGKIRCTSNDAAAANLECGPVLFRFKELKPPLLEGVPHTGWRLDHWESSIREPDGTAAPRKGPMPDGRYYLNGFGYSDTGQLETVTAVFRRGPDAGAEARDR